MIFAGEIFSLYSIAEKVRSPRSPVTSCSLAGLVSDHDILVVSSQIVKYLSAVSADRIKLKS